MADRNQIIEGVKKHPILYDTKHPYYRCYSKRDAVWNQLAEELNVSGIDVRRKWKNIRDCYKKYLRSMAPGCSAMIRSYKNWTWAMSMEFCRPFIVLTEPELNSHKTECSDTSERESLTTIDASLYEDENEHNPEENQNSKPTNSTNKGKMISGIDATDLIFLGYSSIVKSFNSTKQAIVKMKIAQIIMEEELQHAEGTAYQSHLICSPLSSTGNYSKTEVNLANEPNEAPSSSIHTKPTKIRKRTRKRKIDDSLNEYLSPSSVMLNEDSIDIKTEVVDLSD